MISLEETRAALTGPVTSIFTPFQRDGSIDFAGLRNFIDFCLAGGSPAIILTAGDSRYTILTDDEIAEVTRVTAEHTNGRALVVAADKSWGTRKEVEFAQYACEVGADLLMVKPPDLVQCTEETYVDYYAAVAEHIPIMVVNNVFRGTPLAQSMAVLEALRDRVPGIVAVKDDVCGEFARKMSLLVYDQWAVIAGGQKQNHLNMLPYGCDGYFSTFGKFKPAVAQAYWEAVQVEDWPLMREIVDTYDMPFFDFVLNEFQVRFIPAMYGTLEIFGIFERWNRPPCYSLNDAEMERLKEFLKGKGLL
jgi:4-hydroxy-tetrahydrodipicolinate synthase